MKYVKTFEKHRNTKVNEEFIFGMFKNLFNSVKTAINKTKGGKEVDAIYDKYIKLINDQLKNKAKIELSLKSEEEIMKSEEKKPEEGEKKTESKIFEAEDAAPLVGGEEKENKLDANTLRQKMTLITQIINLQKDAAKKEMENVLKKYGGVEKNPDLKILIDNKIREFDLSLLNSQIEYLEKSGDKEAVKKLAVSRDKVAKDIQQNYKNLGKGESTLKVGEQSFNIGKKYRYKTEDGIKTIIIKGESDEDGKIKAAYLEGNTDEQNFTTSNVEIGFKPEKNKTYKYYSTNNQKQIDVEVVGDPDNTGMIEVKSGENTFKVEVGALI